MHFILIFFESAKLSEENNAETEFSIRQLSPTQKQVAEGVSKICNGFLYIQNHPKLSKNYLYRSTIIDN